MAPKNRPTADALVAIGTAASTASVLRKGWSARFISQFASTALRRGLHSGSRGWLYAGAAATGLRVAHRYVAKREEVLRVKLKPGQSLSIREISRAK